jgi:DNA-binding CsgD family transcriptional regulator
MANDISRIEAVARRLGETVLDPSRWVGVMEEVCSAVKTSGAALIQGDVRTSDIPVTDSAAEYVKAYFDNQLHLNDIRAVRGVPRHLAGQSVVIDQDIFASEREMARNPLYAHLEDYGYRWWAAIGFKAGPAPWALALQRKKIEGPFGEEEVKALSPLSRHLTEAATLSSAVGRQSLLNVTNALRMMDRPALALGRLGIVLEVNDLAVPVFDDSLRIHNRRLFAKDAAARQRLDELDDQLRTTPESVTIAVRPIVVRREAKKPILIHVLPVSGAARSPFLGARAVLVLEDLETRSHIDPAMLSHAFGITSGQARVASLLATGMSVEEIALQLEISVDTVRNHIKGMFARTGTRRQSELVILISRLRF